MSVRVSVKLNQSKINKLVEASKQAFKLTVEDVLKDIKDSQVVPKDTGNLESTGSIEFVSEAVASIVFDTPYAKRLYWHPEYNFKTDKNSNAQGRWMDMYMSGSKRDFVKERYFVHLKELSKGLVR
ncbi:minor capsid protein [Clostridium beijerinckii]|uniref:minor capsid protein n=1 Tax=Clostridium beijerinckii TaxID=1520 RepID=UPI00047E661A|nr:minor capsid protein [Clostridium beijerinckii]